MKKTDNRTNTLRIRVQSFMLYESWALPVVHQAQILRKVIISFSRWPDSLLLPCSYTAVLYFAGYHSQYNVTCALASQNIYAPPLNDYVWYLDNRLLSKFLRIIWQLFTKLHLKPQIFTSPNFACLLNKIHT